MAAVVKWVAKLQSSIAKTRTFLSRYAAAEFESRKAEWFPSQEDYDYVKSCMVKVHEVGKIANWLAPPHQGIDNKPFEFEYVRFH